MQKRKRRQGLEVSALSLGCMGYGKARDVLKEIEAGAAAIRIEGARYPEAMMRRAGL